ncbi:hypothetical protein HAT92_01365 [Dickeya solani]|nr:hypothetical protein HAT92_01365 [Dickeya solani]
MTRKEEKNTGREEWRGDNPARGQPTGEGQPRYTSGMTRSVSGLVVKATRPAAAGAAMTAARTSPQRRKNATAQGSDQCQ